MTGYIEVTVEFKEEDGQWSAVCRELGTAACGDTMEEAVKAIKDLLALHLNALEDAGERRRFFKEHKIQFHRTRPRDGKAVVVPLGSYVRRFVEPVSATM